MFGVQAQRLWRNRHTGPHDIQQTALHLYISTNSRHHTAMQQPRPQHSSSGQWRYTPPNQMLNNPAHCYLGDCITLPLPKLHSPASYNQNTEDTQKSSRVGVQIVLSSSTTPPPPTHTQHPTGTPPAAYAAAAHPSATTSTSTTSRLCSWWPSTHAAEWHPAPPHIHNRDRSVGIGLMRQAHSSHSGTCTVDPAGAEHVCGMCDDGLVHARAIHV